MPTTTKAAPPAAETPALLPQPEVAVQPGSLADETVSRPFWDALAAPFPVEDIERKPQQVKRGDQPRWECREGTPASKDGIYCGGYHGQAVHLDYIGHAGITGRLNDVCTPAGWTWEPLSTDPTGLPFVREGSMWIRLGIRDPFTGEWVWKLGVGDDDGGTRPKVMIGDALRNAAMRFGVGLYLWSKSERARALTDFEAPSQANTLRQAAEAAHAAQEAPQEPREPTAAQAAVQVTIGDLDERGRATLLELWNGNVATRGRRLVDLDDRGIAVVKGMIEQVLKGDPWATGGPAQDPSGPRP